MESFINIIINVRLEENVSSLREEMSALVEIRTIQHDAVPKINACDTCIKLEERVESIQPDNYQRYLVLDGIPLVLVNNTKDENLHVVAVCNSYNVGLLPGGIAYCFRTGRESKGRVIVAFKNKFTRDALYYAYLKHHSLHLKDVFTESDIASRIYITERITVSCKLLLRRCAVLKRNKVISKYYSRNRTLHLKKHELRCLACHGLCGWSTGEGYRGCQLLMVTILANI